MGKVPQGRLDGQVASGNGPGLNPLAFHIDHQVLATVRVFGRQQHRKSKPRVISARRGLGQLKISLQRLHGFTHLPGNGFAVGVKAM